MAKTYMRDSPRCPGTRWRHWSRSHYRWRHRRTDPGSQPPYWQKYLGRQRKPLSSQCSVDTSSKVLGDITRQCYISLSSTHVTDEAAASEPLFSIKSLIVWVNDIDQTWNMWICCGLMEIMFEGPTPQPRVKAALDFKSHTVLFNPFTVFLSLAAKFGPGSII